MSEKEQSASDYEAAELQARIDAARERAKAAKDAIELAQRRREAEQAEIEARSDEIIAEFVAKHGPLGGKIAAVRCDLGVVIVQRAAAPLFKRYLDTENPKTQDAESLVRPNVIHPTRDEFDSWCKDQPLLLGRVGVALADLAGAKRSEQQGKF